MGERILEALPMELASWVEYRPPGRRATIRDAQRTRNQSKAAREVCARVVWLRWRADA